MNYTVEEYLLNEYNAASKARKDVSHFVLQNGFRTLFRNDKSKNHGKFNKAVLTICLIVKLFKLKRNDTLFIQTSLIVLRYILKIKAIKKFKVIYLIHDLYSLRFNTEKSIRDHKVEIGKDMSLMSQCDYVIAHNEKMVKKLKDFGCTSYLISLKIFDYDCHYPERRRQIQSGEKIKIVFAGYLTKACFLEELDKVLQKSYSLIIYGAPEIPLTSSIYMGSVDADKLPNVIEGHFGLIWEGKYKADERDNYISINNPHKMSMYIVAGLPIIAWDKSAAAIFIKDNNIGITISSLDELDTAIKISPKEYSMMVDNCLKIREKLINGCFLKEALQTILT